MVTDELKTDEKVWRRENSHEEDWNRLIFLLSLFCLWLIQFPFDVCRISIEIHVVRRIVITLTKSIRLCELTITPRMLRATSNALWKEEVAVWDY